MCSGIAMLTFALLMSARMGIFQETLYKQYGKHSKEALFYNVSLLSAPTCRTTFKQLQGKLKLHLSELDCVCLSSQHCLPLPGFLLLSTDIYNHCVYFSQSSAFHSFIHSEKVVAVKFEVFFILNHRSKLISSVSQLL